MVARTRRVAALGVGALAAGMLLGCSAARPSPVPTITAAPPPSTDRDPSAVSPSPTGHATDRTAASPSAHPTSPGPASPSPSGPTSATAAPSSTPSLDPDNVFYVEDETWYASPWYEGTGRIMIGYGCTEAPYYAPDPRCDGRQGFHHGIDVALPCGTELRSAVTATVVDPDSPGRLGAAYGSTAFRLRDPDRDRDVVIAHAETVAVEPDRTVSPGEVLGTVGDRGSPDGCHLHLEVRPVGGAVSQAVDPADLLALTD